MSASDTSLFPAASSQAVQEKSGNLHLILRPEERTDGLRKTTVKCTSAKPETINPFTLGNDNTTLRDFELGGSIPVSLDGKRRFGIWQAIQAEITEDDGTPAGRLWIPQSTADQPVWQAYVHTRDFTGRLVPHTPGRRDRDLLEKQVWDTTYSLDVEGCELAQVFGPGKGITFENYEYELLIPDDLDTCPIKIVSTEGQFNTRADGRVSVSGDTDWYSDERGTN